MLVKDLNLGDIVRLRTEEFSDCKVYQKLPNGDCKVWRPYVASNNVLYSGGRIIPYIGLEDFTLLADTNVTRIRESDPLL